MKIIVVKQEEQGKRLDKFIKGYMPSLNNSLLYKSLRKKNILLNENKADGSIILKGGDKISIFFKDETIDKFIKKNIDKYDKINNINNYEMDIVYEDNNMIIVDKNENMLSQSADGEDVSINEICIKYMIDKKELNKDIYMTQKPSIVNRLDRNTKGLIIFAKNYKVCRELSDKLKNGKIEKYYEALVNGIMEKDEDVLDAYLYKNEDINKVYVSDIKKDGNVHIKTEYKIIKKYKEATHIKIKLITGKSHQIRAHLSYIGHPIVCDKKYMDRDAYEKNVLEYNTQYQKLICKELVIDGFILSLTLT